MHIGGNEDSVEVFCLFSIYMKDKAFNSSKTKAFLPVSSNVLLLRTYVMYLNIGRDKNKITMNKMMVKSMC